MKILFIPAKWQGEIKIDREELKKLPTRIGLIASIQYIDFLEKLKAELEKLSKKIFIGKGKQLHKGQVLGCDVSAAEVIKDRVDCFLFIGTGKFHPIMIALKTGKKTFIIEPSTGKIRKLSKTEIEKIKIKQKVMLTKFINATNIGIIISLKQGQYSDLEKIKEIEKKYPEKKFYYFLADNINKEELQNFPFIECWINTACPRLQEDLDIININFFSYRSQEF